MDKLSPACLLLVALLLLTACASHKGLDTKARAIDPASLKTERAFRGDTQVNPAWPRQRWWDEFGDAQLSRLVDEALASSPNMRAAQARIEKANAVAATAATARKPQTNTDIASSRQRFSENSIYPPPIAGHWAWQNQLQLNLHYEFDFWGKNRAAYDSALGLSRAAQADAYAATLVLSTSVVRTYVQLQHAYERHDIAAATLQQRERLLDLARQRVSAGLDSQVELKQAETGIPTAREDLVQIDETMELARNQLAALLGRGPDRGLEITRPAVLAKNAVALPASLPADLIGRRADVAAQRWRVEAALQDTKSARAQFYPDLNLVAFAGLQSLGFSRWLDAGSRTFGVGPAVSLPFFEAGRLRANLAGRNADYDLAVEQYNQTLIDAVHDVADQLATLRSVAAQQKENAAELAHANAVNALAQERYRAGIASYVQVLSTESQVLAQKSAAADLSARELDVSLNLVRALGGGYGDAGAPATVPTALPTVPPAPRAS